MSIKRFCKSGKPPARVSLFSIVSQLKIHPSCALRTQRDISLSAESDSRLRLKNPEAFLQKSSAKNFYDMLESSHPAALQNVDKAFL